MEDDFDVRTAQMLSQHTPDSAMGLQGLHAARRGGVRNDPDPPPVRGLRMVHVLVGFLAGSAMGWLLGHFVHWP